MNQVLVSPAVLDYLDQTNYILYKKGYFGFPEAARKYIDKLLEFIYHDLPNCSKKNAPDYFKRFGKNMQFVKYQPNKHTTWYIFFNYNNHRYLVRYITNNHVDGQNI